MEKHFPLLHSVNFAVRFLATVWLFLYLTANKIMTFVPAILICSGVLLVAFVMWRGYMYMDRMLSVSLKQVIMDMPLFDLLETLSEREDVQQLIVDGTKEP